MFYFSPQCSQQLSVKQIFAQRVFLGPLMCALMLGTACSSHTLPSSNTIAPTTGTTQVSSTTNSLTISGSLPSATVGSAYNSTVAVSGGTLPYTFTVVSGQLPQALALGDISGTISGTPSQSGNSRFTLQVSDANGNLKQQAFEVAVANAPSQPPTPTPTPTSNTSSNAQSFSDLQRSGGWSSYGQQAPNYVDCSPSPCNGIQFWMGQGINSPSMSGSSSGFSVGGNIPFSDALFNNHLIGPGSSQGLPDDDQTLVPSLHDFTYDVYFYGGALWSAQALEFDINQFFDNLGFIFGHECRIAAGNEWDVWDNQNKRWTPTGIPCYPNENGWNHLTLKVQRNSNNELVYQSITLNGQTDTLNWTFPPGKTPGWYGVTVNYQMDGNSKQDSYTVYLDNLTFTYE